MKRLSKILNPKLLSYQRDAVRLGYNFILKSPTHSCYNASEMGTGKTIMTIDILNVLRRLHKLKKTLIICPACVEYTWKEELEKWLSDPLSISVLDSGKKYTDENLKADVCITSYGLIRSRNERTAYLASKRFQNIVYDESHNLKNTRALQTRAAFYLWDCVKTRQALSGTPFLANIVDGYSLFHRMAPKHFPDFKNFTDRYSYKTITPWAIKYFGVKRPKELRRIIRSNFYFRYTLEDGETELPPVQWIRIALPDTYSVEKEIKAEIKEYEEKLLSQVLFNLDNYVEAPLTPALAQHRRLQAEKAVKPILEFSLNVLEQGKQLVIFGWHKSVLKIYQERLKKYNPGLIVGDTSLTLRDKYRKEFQAKTRQLLIINYVAGGYGLTLTSGNTVVLAELDWNPTTLAQAAGRFRRIGQRKTVNIYYFPTISSIDERVISVVRSKAASFNKVM